jgi:hypothetical protein
MLLYTGWKGGELAYGQRVGMRPEAPPPIGLSLGDGAAGWPARMPGAAHLCRRVSSYEAAAYEAAARTKWERHDGLSHRLVEELKRRASRIRFDRLPNQDVGDIVLMQQDDYSEEDQPITVP